jgi:hypothetical protein
MAGRRGRQDERAADADGRVIVREAEVVVDRDRPEKREVEEPVTLQSCPELLLESEPGDEGGGEREPDEPRDAGGPAPP